MPHFANVPRVLVSAAVLALATACSAEPASVAATAHHAPVADAAPAPAPGEPSWPPAPVVPLPSQPPPALVTDVPLPEQLAMGLAVIRYRAENLRIVPVYGPAALDVSPRIGHIHVTVDGAQWHWADGSGEPLILQGLPPGPHQVRIDLADPTHRVLDSKTVEFTIP